MHTRCRLRMILNTQGASRPLALRTDPFLSDDPRIVALRFGLAPQGEALADKPLLPGRHQFDPWRGTFVDR